MVFTPDDNSLSLDQDTNQFFVQAKIKSQISYSKKKNISIKMNKSYLLLEPKMKKTRKQKWQRKKKWGKKSQFRSNKLYP